MLPHRNPKTADRRLPPILRKTCLTSMSGYSKAAQGLFVLPWLIGVFTDSVISPGTLLRQLRPFRCAVGTPDKEFRYLRTVIVTAAVHQGLDSRLAPLLVTFWHWASDAPYTSPCGFA